MSRHLSRSGASAPSRSVAPFHRGPAAVAPVTSPNAAPPAHAPNAALLIDFDNVTMGIRSDLQEELKNLLSSDIVKGKVAVRRAYADWRRYPQYIVPLTEASIDLIFAPAYGSSKKNATDIRLAIDALELVFTRPEIGTFVLLSGDSDFSSMVIKLKEYGKYVIGVGIRESSSDLLVMNCDEYYSYNALAGLVKTGEDETTRWDPWELVTEAVGRMKRNGDVMRSDRLKQVMQEIDASFDEKNLGHPKFSRFVQDAQHRGLLHVTKLESGQLEVDVPEGTTSALAPSIPAPSAESETRREGDRDRDDRRGRRGRRGRGRDRYDRERDGDRDNGAESIDIDATVDAETSVPLDETAEVPIPQYDPTLVEPTGIRPLPSEDGGEAGTVPAAESGADEGDVAAAEDTDRRDRGRRRGRGRDRFRDRDRGERTEAPREGDRETVAAAPTPSSLGAPFNMPVADTVGRSGERLTRSDAFDLVRRAVESLVSGDAVTSASAARQRAFELLGRDSESLAPRMFERILQDAHDANLIDLRRRGDDWEVARAADAASIVEQLKTADDAHKAAAAAQAAAQPAAPRGMGARGIGGRVAGGRGKAGVPPELLMVGVVAPVGGAAPVSAVPAAPVAAPAAEIAAPSDVAPPAGEAAPAATEAPSEASGTARGRKMPAKKAPNARKAAPSAKAGNKPQAAAKAPAKPAPAAKAPAAKTPAARTPTKSPAKKAATKVATKTPAKKAAKKK
ncbi:NYN domain-containing protein [Gemmatimonas aurantiaca]|uniref:NYN domain-containing protein n=1 Tax=Gemmatimonas aurantiaca TaxID=173480 RepID=UPI00301BEC29